MVGSRKNSKWQRLKREKKCTDCGAILPGSDPDMDTGIRMLRWKSDQGWWRIAGIWRCPNCIDGRAVEQWIEANRQYEKAGKTAQMALDAAPGWFLCKAGKEPKDTPLQGG